MKNGNTGGTGLDGILSADLGIKLTQLAVAREKATTEIGRGGIKIRRWRGLVRNWGHLSGRADPRGNRYK